MNKEVMFSSKNQEWETPDDLFKMLDMEFNFQMDLAANEENAKCKVFVTEEMDSLKFDWLNNFGTRCMWLNPPYGRGIKDWIKKCDEEAQKGAKIVALLPARTDTKWFHNHIYRKYEVRFLKGRIYFEINGKPILDKNGKPTAAPFPSMIVIFENVCPTTKKETKMPGPGPTKRLKRVKI